jgi:hypothetical protein
MFWDEDDAEKTVTEENSPYPEVRAAVPNTDDPNIQCVVNSRDKLI